MSGSSSALTGAAARIQLGLKENWRQFSLLVLINAFVGGIAARRRATRVASVASGVLR
jgi:hypothetical protein